MSAIREARKAKGLTPEELAAGARTSLATIRRAEIGRNITLQTARNIAEVLGMTLDELFGNHQEGG